MPPVPPEFAHVNTLFQDMQKRLKQTRVLWMVANLLGVLCAAFLLVSVHSYALFALYTIIFTIHVWSTIRAKTTDRHLSHSITTYLRKNGTPHEEFMALSSVAKRHDLERAYSRHQTVVGMLMLAWTLLIWWGLSISIAGFLVAGLLIISFDDVLGKINDNTFELYVLCNSVAQRRQLG